MKGLFTDWSMPYVIYSSINGSGCTLYDREYRVIKRIDFNLSHELCKALESEFGCDYNISELKTGEMVRILYLFNNQNTPFKLNNPLPSSVERYFAILSAINRGMHIDY